MNFEYSDKSLNLQEKISDFMNKHIFPNEKNVLEFRINNPWKHSPKFENLKSLAKKEGLWNLFLPKDYGKLSPGLSNLEYAPLAELMGRCSFSSERCKCSARAAGNMGVVAKYGDGRQDEEGRKP